MAQRDDDEVFVYKFYGARGGELHCGLTNNPERREREHRYKFNEPVGVLAVEGGPMPRWQAREWERANRCSPYGAMQACGETSGGWGVGEALLAAGIAAGVVALGAAVVKALSGR